MDISDFEYVNQSFAHTYTLLLNLIFTVGVLNFSMAAGFLLGKVRYRWLRVSYYMLAFLMVVLFLQLYRYHRLLSTVVYFDPFSGGGFKISLPFWIEKERLLFWLLCYTFVVIHSERLKHRRFTAWLNTGNGFFLLAIFLTRTPQPIPEMLTLMRGYLHWLHNPSFSSEAVQLFRSLIGKYYLYSTWYMWIHPPMLFMAYACFTANFFANLGVITTESRIYDRIGYVYAKTGYFLLTIGLLIGYPWALEAWEGQSWWWAPIISSSFMLWFFYSAYLHARLRSENFKRAAVFGILGYASVVIAYLVIFILPGVHAYV